MYLEKVLRPRQLFLTVALICMFQVVFGGAAQAQVDCTTQTDMPEIECDFLVEIYDTMGGPFWFFTTWNHNQTPCSWAGITCEGGRIVGLSFYEENLSGTLPSSIANLTLLETMSSRESNISLPPEFYNLTNIRSLSGYNSAFFQVTPQLLNFPGLEGLSLISDPGSLTGQKRASRGGGIPTFLGQLQNLKSLGLYNQGYQGPIPTEIGTLTNLEHLNLASNYLTSPLPTNIQNLTNLKTLNLGANEFAEPLPPEWVFLTQLEWLGLSGNHFRGTLPNGWGNLANLRHLSLFRNEIFSFVPPFWSRLTALEVLNLSDNSITGPIPAEWGSFPNLEWIDLSNNRFSGGLHANLGDATAFPGRTLYLANNHLNGEVPPSWADGQLGQLSIDFNCLTTTDLDIVALLDSLDPDWFDTQCLPLFIDGFDAGSTNNWDRLVSGIP